MPEGGESLAHTTNVQTTQIPLMHVHVYINTLLTYFVAQHLPHRTHISLLFCLEVNLADGIMLS